MHMRRSASAPAHTPPCTCVALHRFAFPCDVAWKQLLQELGQLGATINTADEQAGLLAASVPYNVSERGVLDKDTSYLLWGAGGPRPRAPWGRPQRGRVLAESACLTLSACQTL
eukprot:299419-Chlamydomonas_euryale.AAC.1